MYIITKTQGLENSEDGIFRVQATELERTYENAGYTKRERSYKLRLGYKDYIVICPEYRDDKKSRESVIIVPDFFIPRRPYPVYVYLYGIDKYSKNPSKSQRWAASETRKKFNLTKFAHTTIGRALKTFVHKMEACATDGTQKTLSEDTTSLEEKITESQEKQASVQESASPKNTRIPKTSSTLPLRVYAAEMLKCDLSSATRQQIVEIGTKLARERYKINKQFLL